MKRLLIAAVSASLCLVGLTNVAIAQDKGVAGISTNADGSYVTSTAGVNPTAGGDGGTIVYGDITTGPGNTVIGPPSVVTGPPAPDPVPAAAVEPDAETVAAEPVPVDTTVATDSAVATESDLDADNIADALEWELGLDGNNADSDADGVADGDEINIYGTDALVWDTDGDGVADGEELFGIQTDPLVWDDFSAEADATVAQQAAEEVQSFEEAAPIDTTESLTQGTNENLTATDGDAAALGTGSASAAPGTVTRGKGTSILGPDGTYNVSETAPANVTISGDTDVLSPPVAAPADTSGAPADTSATPSCDSYVSWYDAQVAYETAGLTAADPALVASLDPDYDGIACEEGM